MEEKVVHMELKVDLECYRCYKKVRKVLCKIPQIRDQFYNENQGTVLIKVVFCRPEKIMNKISCKGHKSIKSIHIKEPEKAKEKPKVVAQPNDGNPPQSVSNSPLYEGRPSYQYHDSGIPTAPPSDIEQPVHDTYNRDYNGEDAGTGYYVGQLQSNPFRHVIELFFDYQFK